ncbi:MAG: tRNA pseudouridine(38-40) synthase TruA [Tenacibaculum sp.]
MIFVLLRYFVELSYNGKNYHGWQIQPRAISVQQKINTALSTLLKEDISVVGAGRTDAGVHALQMFAHFDTDQNIVSDITYKLNSFLPNDIVIYNVFMVNNKVHARFDAISRSYEYRIWLGKNPFLQDTTWQLLYSNINVEAMNRAANMLLEYSDFKCFSKVKNQVHSFVCKISKAHWKCEQNELTFYISADRFLWNMVRAIVGTLLEIGLGKKTVSDFRKIIESKDRTKAGKSAPAKGLFLTKVSYSYLQ